MSEVIESYRPAYTIELAEQECRLAAGPFCNGRLTYILHVDPAILLQETDHQPGVKRFPVGEALQEYRMQKQLSQSMNYPMEIPSGNFNAAIAGIRKADFKLWDAPLVRFLLDQGASEIPVMVSTADKEELEEIAMQLGAETPLKSVSDLTVDVEAGKPEPIAINENDFTLFVTIEELEESINSHMSFLDSTISIDREGMDEDRDDFYRSFNSNKALLDGLIMVGSPGVFVKKGWDGHSIYEAMKSKLDAQKHLLEPQQVEPIELVDRFARIFERAHVYNNKPGYNKVLDPDDTQRIERLSEILADKISQNPGAISLAKTELCPEAQNYLASFQNPSPNLIVDADFEERPGFENE